MRPMRLRVLSDLHLEFAKFAPGEPRADVVILAGDIHIGRNGVKWAREAFGSVPVVYVLGNHEYYGQATPKLLNDLRKDAAGSAVHVLEREAWVHEGVRFLGCTLWTDMRLRGQSATACYDAGERMTDYKRIRVAPVYRRLRPQDTVLWHQRSRAWLEEQLAAPFDGPTVIVTHHAPTERSLPADHATDLLAPAYASNLDELVAASNARVWVHGHIHRTVRETLGTTRVVCNPRGYPGEGVAGFRADFTVEV